MSGGSFNYLYRTIEYEYVGRMQDIVLDEMMEDLVKVLHDLEWWQSADISEEDYRETVEEFKKKYFHNYTETAKQIVTEEIEKMLKEAGIKK